MIAVVQGTERAAIQVLATDVAERIAAGEVIERPTSVVRELVDNAIDAGATEIAVELRGGGLELIRVSDDGCGIPEDEVELAFERHATSKLRAFEDLVRLATLGFRGEALPSIAAVAEITVLTRPHGAPWGTSVTVRGSQLQRRARQARQVGTTVTVRALFHNVPARLKFLPASRSESLLVGQLVRRYALAHPGLRFSLTLDGHLSFRSSGRGRLEDAVADVYGTAIAEAMRALPATTVGGAQFEGLLSGRTVTRPGRQHVTLIVNGRWASGRELATALEAAYRPHLPRGRHPIAVIHLEVPPHEVDPNVHPAKTEVRLLHEREISQALAEQVRATYARGPALPPSETDFSLLDPQLSLALRPARLVAEASPPWGRESAAPELLGRELAGMRIVGQVQESLVLVEGRTGLFLVDQHRAHERVIYERLRGRAGPAVATQALLDPVLLELRPNQAALVEERRAELETLGFLTERFGSHEYLVRTVPALDGQEDLTPHLASLLEEAAGAGESWHERLLIALACRAGVRRGRALVESQLGSLVSDLAATAAPAACPHGSPLILHFSEHFLHRQFGW